MAPEINESLPAVFESALLCSALGLPELGLVNTFPLPADSLMGFVSEGAKTEESKPGKGAPESVPGVLTPRWLF